MAPRKSDARRSDVSVVVAVPPPTPRNGQAAQQRAASERRERDRDKDAVAVEDLALPKSIITRLAKGVLPPNTQIQANAILAMSKGATLFINYLASQYVGRHHANEHTTNAGKKTISPADVFKALNDTEFSFLRAPLEAEFAKFNAVQTEKRSSYRQKVRAAKDGPASSSKGDDTDMADAAGAAASGPVDGPPAKRPRFGSLDGKAGTDGDDDHDDDDAGMHNGDAAAAAAGAGQEDDDGDGSEEEDDDESGRADSESGDETQDALELRAEEADDDPDEALDGDESD